MAQITNNLGLIIPEKEDKINVAELASNFNKLDEEVGKLEIDYLEHIREIGNWIVKQYHSGITECYARIPYSQVVITANGNRLGLPNVSLTPETLDFPVSFIDPPVIVASAEAALKKANSKTSLDPVVTALPYAWLDCRFYDVSNSQAKFVFESSIAANKLYKVNVYNPTTKKSSTVEVNFDATLAVQLIGKVATE